MKEDDTHVGSYFIDPKFVNYTVAVQQSITKEKRNEVYQSYKNYTEVRIT